ncbi:MAG: heavy metal translocating P-type ATPase [Desulfovibrio sp.]|jgi:Cu2+-exporting ATPase|nr:heavy metal translocating P-type ATPase [Desulfovibrio sp.]
MLAHDLPGRMRLRPLSGGQAARPAAAAIAPLASDLFSGAQVSVSASTGSILLLYTDARLRARVLAALPGEEARKALRGNFSLPVKSGEARKNTPPDNTPQNLASNPIPAKFRSFFYPRLLTRALAILRALPYILRAAKAVLCGKLNLNALDGAALLVCILRRDFRSLSSITFFFALGEFLADRIEAKSRASLEESLALNISNVWIRDGEQEVRIPASEVRPGHLVVARAGLALPVDGIVAEGEGLVNQASMTGEPLPIRRSKGASVYAGTVLEEGELLITAVRAGSNTRIHNIARAIEVSEAAKAAIQSRYERMADAIVPYNFLLSGLIYAAGRNPAQAGAVLLVDYSCAIRLATPLTIFTAMREGAEAGILIKGGKYMEALAEADVAVFDKTGTLTKAKPALAEVIPFAGHERNTVLRLAACLEEHFPHPVGRAVVRAAEKEGLKHQEEHAELEYVVAHGIASQWRGKRVLIGSDHFVLEDEGIPISPEQERHVAAESAQGRSILYLAVGGSLAGILSVEDTLRPEAAEIVRALRADGIRRVIMLTGDGELTAASIAAEAGIDEYRARLLPADKAAFVADLKKRGFKVLMVGDGINDSQALSAADAGVSLSGGADLAREVANIVLTDGNLAGLPVARILSRRAITRIRRNFYTSLFWNSIFLAGGLLGLLTPGISALLHNATTTAVAVNTLRPLLNQERDK